MPLVYPIARAPAARPPHALAPLALVHITAALLGPVPRNLLAASDDGLIHLYADRFALLTSLCTFPLHEATDGLAVHPLRWITLAVGRTGGLAMLNLVRGRCTFVCCLECPASVVTYAEDDTSGNRFVMAVEEKVIVHDSEDTKIVHEMDCGKRVLSYGPAKNGVLYTGGEDRGITAWDLSNGKGLLIQLV